MFSARLLIILCLLSSLASASSPVREKETVKLVARREGVTIVLVARNTDLYAPYHGSLDLSPFNMVSEKPWAEHFTVPAGRSVELCRLTPEDKGQSYRYNANIRYNLGLPDSEANTGYAYVFPFPEGSRYLLTQGYFGHYTHQNCRCLDFDLPEGSPVCAARSGTVISLKQDSSLGGPGLRFADEANLIEVLHSDGTWATYAHLQKNSARVRLGQKVKAGQRLALSGHTGQADGPHLHFTVSRATWQGQESVPTRFVSKSGPLDSLKSGRYYQAVRPPKS